jgi:hypothetical protein
MLIAETSTRNWDLIRSKKRFWAVKQFFVYIYMLVVVTHILLHISFGESFIRTGHAALLATL